MLAKKLLLCVIIILFFIACSFSPPLILDVRFERIEQNRLSVYVQPSIELDRIQEIRVKHEKSGLIWIITTVEGRFVSVRKNSSDQKWFGSDSLYAPIGETIPQGVYSVVYTDVGGSQAFVSFTL